MRFTRLGFVVLSLWFSASAGATSFLFTGTFLTDDQLQVLQFTAPSADVILRTWSYAGGTTSAGTGAMVIQPGGFDPVLSLFDGLQSTSNLIGNNDNGVGVATDITGNAFDSLLEITTLTPGATYFLVLSQADNFANGPTYGDGFHEQGQGNFTPGMFGCAASSFCDATPAIRNGNYAVEVIGTGSAVDVTAPEPSTLFVITGGIAGLALLRRRRRTV